MEEEEKVKAKLDDIHNEFKQERFDVALMKLELVGKMIFSSLDNYNKNH